MLQNLAGLIHPRRRVKTVIWLTGIVVVVQCFVLVADHFRSSNDAEADCFTLKHSDISPPRQELYNEQSPPALVLGLKVQTTRVFTHEEEIPVVSATTETGHTSNENELNRATEAASPTPNEEGINVELPAASAEHEHKASFTRDDDSGITAAVSKEDVSIDEAVTNCKQLKNRTTVRGYLNLHEWHYWCGHAVDDLRREPLFPFKPQSESVLLSKQV
ncbi:hypothetical protein OS493_033785 [Desmophyllum pertusum]|uniref:Uncharacterized protein n=1 Tax=Desmophyllum pertusum TaxID=174260 RepID=A0A9W9YVH2_9CNID|nr:hypothetical protein OS493_033785 [Desmophyllum pertusum]